MFADIVQKTQTKPPFDNRNFSFPKICNQKKLKKILQKLQKICIKAEEERKQNNFFSKKYEIFFLQEFASNAKKKREAGSAQQQEQSRRRKRDHEELGYAVHVHKNNPQTIFYSTIPHLFFSLLPGDSKLNRLPRSKSSRILNATCQNLGRENLLKYVELGSECHPFKKGGHKRNRWGKVVEKAH
jgi:hypothetical protein